MNHRRALALLIILPCVGGCAGLGRSKGPSHVSGTIQDEAQMPIAGAVVTMMRAEDFGKPDTPDCVVMTKDTGVFKCNGLEDQALEPVPFKSDEIYVIHVSRPGMKEIAVRFSYRPGLDPFTVTLADGTSGGSSNIEGNANQRGHSGTGPTVVTK